MNKYKIVDLSVPTEACASERFPVEIVHELHHDNGQDMTRRFGCTIEDIPDGCGHADDIMRISAHIGTHVDAPWHYFPTSEGKKARTIDEIPLKWFYGDGVVLDMTHKERGSGITVDDLKESLRKIDYEIKPWDIVMIRTGADKHWGTAEYCEAGCGMTREATLWLIEQGVRVMGIDAWGWDRPISVLKEEFARTGDRRILWGAHRAGIEKEYCHIEKLANLHKVPPFGFKVVCFPVKLKGGSAGFARVVAIAEE
jgi:kynurenine formamidase